LRRQRRTEFLQQILSAGGGEDRRGGQGAAGQSSTFGAICSAMKGIQSPTPMFVFVPAGQGGSFMKQYAERGLDKAGIKVIGPGDVMDDDILAGMGDAATRHLHRAFVSRPRIPPRLNKESLRATRKRQPAPWLHGGGRL